MTRIALVGAPGSGKTYIANAWCDIVDGQRLSFADAVRREVAEALAATDDQGRSAVEFYALLMDPATKDEYRSLTQVWGTEFRRAQNPDYWVEKVAVLLAKTGAVTPLVVDDCRFPNEYETLRRADFLFIGLESGETTHELTDDQRRHESEQHWPRFEFDQTLSYVKGPEIQAARLVLLLKEMGE